MSDVHQVLAVFNDEVGVCQLISLDLHDIRYQALHLSFVLLDVSDINNIVVFKILKILSQVHLN